MSFLFRKILGQNVVHRKSPSSASPQAAKESAAATTTASSGDKGGGAPPSPSLLPNGASSSGAVSSPKAPGPLSSHRSSPIPFNNSVPGDKAGVAATTSAFTAQRQSSTSTATLLLRITGCTVAQDIRDALQELERCSDIHLAMDASNVDALIQLLEHYEDDESITEPALHILANATDLQFYGNAISSIGGGGSGSASVDAHRMTEKEKIRLRDSHLKTLIGEVSLFLEFMKSSRTFWCRCYAVLLLQRLQEYDPAKVSKSLLAARGIGVLVDVLTDSSNSGILRKEGLVLLSALTLTDTDLQTILAFENSFDSLFDVIQQEGGVYGGQIVRECLTTVLNMLRSNKATQKFFREMGCAARLAALMEAVPQKLELCVGKGKGGGRERGEEPSTSGAAGLEEVKAMARATASSDVMLNVLLGVSILSCVLRSSDAMEEGEALFTRDALLQCNLLQPLMQLAFCGYAIDDGTRIEAVRVLALLLDSSKRAIEQWITVPPVYMLIQNEEPYTVKRWTPSRALLCYICETGDTTMVNAAAQVLISLLSIKSHESQIIRLFVTGLYTPVEPHGQSGVPKAPQPPKVYGAAVTAADESEGVALARALLGSKGSAVTRYYAAQTLRLLLTTSATAAVDLVSFDTPVVLQQMVLHAFPSLPGCVVSASAGPCFFNYFSAYTTFCLSGGAASQKMNTATLGSLVAVWLAWLDRCPQAAFILANERKWTDALQTQLQREGVVHLRLWCGALLAKICTCTVTAEPNTAGLTSSAEVLLQRLQEAVGPSAALFDDFFFDVDASTPHWSDPVATGLKSLSPVLYDVEFVGLIKSAVTQLRKLLLHSSRSLHAGPPLAVLSKAQPESSTSAAHLASPEGVNHELWQGSLASLPPPVKREQPDELLEKLVERAASKVDMGDEAARDLQLEVQGLRANQAMLRDEVELWRSRATKSENTCEALVAERQQLVAAVADATSAQRAADQELVRGDAQLVEELRENVRLLEEALGSKDEEQHQLVSTLNMMEDQLRRVTSAAQSVSTTHAHDLVLSAPLTAPSSVPSSQQALMLAEKEQLLAAVQSEREQLKLSFQNVKSDLNDLLLLVAELNLRTTPVKEYSVTPIDATSVSPDVVVGGARLFDEDHDMEIASREYGRPDEVTSQQSAARMALVPHRAVTQSNDAAFYSVGRTTILAAPRPGEVDVTGNASLLPSQDLPAINDNYFPVLPAASESDAVRVVETRAFSVDGIQQTAELPHSAIPTSVAHAVTSAPTRFAAPPNTSALTAQVPFLNSTPESVEFFNAQHESTAPGTLPSHGFMPTSAMEPRMTENAWQSVAVGQSRYSSSDGDEPPGRFLQTRGPVPHLYHTGTDVLSPMVNTSSAPSLPALTEKHRIEAEVATGDGAAVAQPALPSPKSVTAAYTSLYEANAPLTSKTSDAPSVSFDAMPVTSPTKVSGADGSTNAFSAAQFFDGAADMTAASGAVFAPHGGGGAPIIMRNPFANSPGSDGGLSYDLK